MTWSSLKTFTFSYRKKNSFLSASCPVARAIVNKLKINPRKVGLAGSRSLGSFPAHADCDPRSAFLYIGARLLSPGKACGGGRFSLTLRFSRKPNVFFLFETWTFSQLLFIWFLPPKMEQARLVVSFWSPPPPNDSRRALRLIFSSFQSFLSPKTRKKRLVQLTHLFYFIYIYLSNTLFIFNRLSFKSAIWTKYYTERFNLDRNQKLDQGCS